MYKKMITLVIAAVLLFSGCGSPQLQVQQSTPTTTTPSTTVVPTLPDTLLVSTDLYEIRRIDGKCYLSFHAGNVKKEDEGCMLHWPWIKFKSMEDLHESLINGTLNEDALETIQHQFALVEGKGFLIQDPEQLYMLQTPEDVKVTEYRIEGDHCSFNLVPKNGGDGLGTLFIATKEKFQEDLEFDRGFETGAREYDTHSKHGPTGGDAYDYDTPAGRRRTVLYRLETENGEVYVRQNYKLEFKEERMAEMHVYGYMDGVYYCIAFYAMDEIPSNNWLTDFRFSRFTPD